MATWSRRLHSASGANLSSSRKAEPNSQLSTGRNTLPAAVRSDSVEREPGWLYPPAFCMKARMRLSASFKFSIELA